MAQELSQLHAHMQGIYCSKCKIIAEPLFTLITTIIIVILEDITIPLQQLRNILQLLETARSSGLILKTKVDIEEKRTRTNTSATGRNINPGVTITWFDGTCKWLLLQSSHCRFPSLFFP